MPGTTDIAGGGVCKFIRKKMCAWRVKIIKATGIE